MQEGLEGPSVHFGLESGNLLKITLIGYAWVNRTRDPSNTLCVEGTSRSQSMDYGDCAEGWIPPPLGLGPNTTRHYSATTATVFSILGTRGSKPTTWPYSATIDI